MPRVASVEERTVEK